MDSKIIKKCRLLRKKGFTLGEIVKIIQLPKTTIYGHVSDVVFSYKGTKRYKNIQEKIRAVNTNFINNFNIKFRKGKCIPGRVVIKPNKWSDGLIFLVSHFMFDGEIRNNGCVYNNRNTSLINSVKLQMKNIFNIEPKVWFNAKTGVNRISYFYVELSSYIKEKSYELKTYIINAPMKEKKIFLQSFFDDEGCAYKRKNKKLIRGYQHNSEILLLIHKLLKDFDIESKIDEKYQEIIISKKENFVKFRDKINFSKEVFINPDRSNSIWRQKLEKREILNKIIASYKN